MGTGNWRVQPAGNRPGARPGHPGEYYLGVRIWPVPLALGLALCIASLFFDSIAVSAVLAVNGMALLWGVRELFQQREQVRKGWFPKKENVG